MLTSTDILSKAIGEKLFFFGGGSGNLILLTSSSLEESCSKIKLAFLFFFYEYLMGPFQLSMPYQIVRLIHFLLFVLFPKPYYSHLNESFRI